MNFAQITIDSQTLQLFVRPHQVLLCRMLLSADHTSAFRSQSVSIVNPAKDPFAVPVTIFGVVDIAIIDQ